METWTLSYLNQANWGSFEFLFIFEFVVIR